MKKRRRTGAAAAEGPGDEAEAAAVEPAAEQAEDPPRKKKRKPPQAEAEAAAAEPAAEQAEDPPRKKKRKPPQAEPEPAPAAEGAAGGKRRSGKALKAAKKRQQAEAQAAAGEGPPEEGGAAAAPGGGAAADARQAVNRTVFVDGLPYVWTVEKVQEHFRECGTIEEVRAPTWQDSGRLRGFAHVTFSDVRGQAKALKMDGTQVGNKGRYLKIEAAKQPGAAAAAAAADPKQFEGKRRLFVKNLPYDAAESEVLALFQKCGKVADVRIPTSFGRCKDAESENTIDQKRAHRQNGLHAIMHGEGRADYQEAMRLVEEFLAPADEFPAHPYAVGLGLDDPGNLCSKREWERSTQKWRKSLKAFVEKYRP